MNARAQLSVISEVVRTSTTAGLPLWLRGGWAMDFFLGEITRPHRDIDFFCRAPDADRLLTELHKLGYRDDPGPPPAQQRDLITPDGTEISFALLGESPDGLPTVAGGPHAGARWPADLLDGPIGRVGKVSCPVISPRAQIEIKEMMPIWVPSMPRRPKDATDIARLRAGQH
ncbi:nucleotidyltransferase domain-containing protein [Winogradskya humida]|uniref:Aminoglycoside-2''-adenylyltransferase n=1 Tax=Winogradskya humida TaxID=113566 RepID=A0ABQ3ZVV0_9ACTN|nr:aminoglycoside adenylyltransferase [Actinoplanes humidus]GIE22741.1 hypothetical protein Ahu01nite_058430 [Actinoplanes humidus]